MYAMREQSRSLRRFLTLLVWQPKNKFSYNFFDLSYAYVEALEPELFGAHMNSDWQTFEVAIDGIKALAGVCLCERAWPECPPKL